MNTFTKQALVFAGGAIGVLLLLFVFTQGGQEQVGPESVYQQAGEATGDSTDNPNDTSAEKKVDPVRWLRAAYGPKVPSVIDLSLLGAPKELAAKAIKFPSTDALVNVQVRIKSTGRCMMGDLDLIVQDWAQDRSAPFIVTLEPLSGELPSGEAAYSYPLDPMALEASVTAALRTPKLNNAEHYGIFICRDAAKKGSCRDKIATDISPLIEQYRWSTPPTVQDRIYYFQYVLAERDTFTVTSAELKPDDYKSMNAYLGNRIGNSAVAASGSATAERLNNIIRSATAELEDDFIVIDLPRFTGKDCPPVGDKSFISLEEGMRMHQNKK